ncbi:MAG: GIY-YIG nuclease family protein, partial [Treponema sp.]|nr:GIY-YIG nuclease family protein [Treponema sp.]
IPSRTAWNIPQKSFHDTFDKWPMNGLGEIPKLVSSVQGPSYVWAMLNDQRILGQSGAARPNPGSEQDPISADKMAIEILDYCMIANKPLTETQIARNPQLSGTEQSHVSRVIDTLVQDKKLIRDETVSPYTVRLLVAAPLPPPPINIDRSSGMTITLKHASRDYLFRHSDLASKNDGEKYQNVFSKYKKTLAETLENERYSKLIPECRRNYPEKMNDKLGEFLFALKQEGDPFYKSFLNKHGDETYVKFELANSAIAGSKGLYVFSKNDEIVYVGKTKDTIGERINSGYGQISPRNCYLDGQSTNCHVNSLIAKNIRGIKFFFMELDDIKCIDDLEKELIGEYKPIWNELLK